MVGNALVEILTANIKMLGQSQQTQHTVNIETHEKKCSVGVTFYSLLHTSRHFLPFCTVVRG